MKDKGRWRRGTGCATSFKHFLSTQTLTLFTLLCLIKVEWTINVQLKPEDNETSTRRAIRCMAEWLSRWYQANAHPNARPGPGHPRAEDSFWGRSPNYAKRTGACRGRGPTRQFRNAASPKPPARGVEGQKTLFIRLYSLHLYLDSRTFPFKIHILVSAKPDGTWERAHVVWLSLV